MLLTPQIVDTSLYDDAVALAAYMRASDALGPLVDFIDELDPSLHQTALLLIGNLASDAFDPESGLSKAILKEVGCFERVLPHLYSNDWLTLVRVPGNSTHTNTHRPTHAHTHTRTHAHTQHTYTHRHTHTHIVQRIITRARICRRCTRWVPCRTCAPTWHTSS